ncbi:MAG: biopolymer transporter ExbD [Bacteroidetes bacterium]|nr:biopolymer transporter ExbD [Bacteroidota bacterium]
MTNIENGGASSRKRAGVRRAVRLNCSIDMTPMVDLGFLLISFFVITTELRRPAAMPLNMPADGPGMDIGNSYALTIIPSADNRLYYYFGNWQDAVNSNSIHTANYAGENSIRKVIHQKQLALDNDPKTTEKRNGLMLLIKPDKNASYKNMVDILDEATINIVKKFAVLKISPEEEKWVHQH